MARPVGFRESTRVLGKPGDMTDEECDQLPIWSDGQQVVSCWKLSPAEIEEVLHTGVVWIGILSGQTQPPCWIAGANPFRQPTEAHE